MSSAQWSRLQILHQSSDIDIENVHGIGADTAIEIKGLPEQPLKNISLRDISLSTDKGITLLDAESINIENVNVNLRIQGGRIC